MKINRNQKLCPGHELLYLTPNSDVAIHNVKTANITIVLTNSSYVSIIHHHSAHQFIICKCYSLIYFSKYFSHIL